jgi:hypothetical protein
MVLNLYVLHSEISGASSDGIYYCFSSLEFCGFCSDLGVHDVISCNFEMSKRRTVFEMHWTNSIMVTSVDVSKYIDHDFQ